jgi:hypothetical protein
VVVVFLGAEESETLFRNFEETGSKVGCGGAGRVAHRISLAIG